MQGSEIILELNDVDQLLISPDSLFYGKRMLITDAEEIIIEEARMIYSNDKISLKIHFPKDETSGKDEIRNAIHQHKKELRSATFFTKISRSQRRLILGNGNNVDGTSN